MDGIPTRKPRHTKSTNVKRTFCFFKIAFHIIAASAPMGVKSAPRFEPMTDAYKAACRF